MRGNSLILRSSFMLRSLLLLLSVLLFSFVNSTANAQPAPALLISQADDGSTEVIPIVSLNDAILKTREGILIWSESGRELWKRHTPSGGKTAENVKVSQVAASPSGTENSEISMHSATTQLDQLAGMPIVRGNGFVTPTPQGRYLSRQITIRREWQNGPIAFPLDRLALSQDNREIATFMINEGVQILEWRDIRGLPDSIVDGLPAGEYTLRSESNGYSATFSIEGDERIEWFESKKREVETLAAGLDQRLALQFLVELLLSQTDEKGRPTPYYADALDLIDESPKLKTPPLADTYVKVLAILNKDEQPSNDVDPTGIPLIDQARYLISRGKLRDAEMLLRDPSLENDSRHRAFTKLYLAVIAAESGEANAETAIRLYRESISLMENEKPSDAWRVHNNLGVFLLNQSQEKLNNHAFRIATGAETPVIAALQRWKEADSAFEIAGLLAGEVDEQHVAIVRLNRARLYGLMADIVATLRPTANSTEARVPAMPAINAERVVRELLKRKTLDTISTASAHEILAQISFRDHRYNASRESADRALSLFVEAGSLAGAESILRLIGLIEYRNQSSVADEEKSLNALLLSHEISELLRKQIRSDETGMSQAGFLSRRAYVNELIIEQLIERDRDREAFEFAEFSKARALEDVLASRRIDRSEEYDYARTVDEILSALPENAGVIEYFVGSRRSYVFAISTDGNVTANLLRDVSGEPVKSRELVERVSHLQTTMRHQAEKMIERLKRGAGFDHRWQDDLNSLYRILIPDEIASEVSSTEHLLIIPHHVLHYVPFAALVTETDTSVDSNVMAKPRFLIDEVAAISIAPSLTSWDLIRDRLVRLRKVNAIALSEFDNAPDLPGVEQDMVNLREAFSDRIATILPGEEAGDRNATALLRSRGMLLIATHGKNLADDPLSSYLLCREPENENAQSGDGKLTALEIFQTDVRAELIVLSACYTGLADRTPLASDDLFGLQRAFLYAGASAVISGLWDVYDDTGPPLMKGFFERMAAGERTDVALAESQREFLNSLRESKSVEPWLHPYFWAVYNVAGNGAIRFAK